MLKDDAARLENAGFRIRSLDVLRIAPLSTGHNIEPSLILRAGRFDPLMAGTIGKIALDQVRADDDHSCNIARIPKIGNDGVPAFRCAPYGLPLHPTLHGEGRPPKPATASAGGRGGVRGVAASTRFLGAVTPPAALRATTSPSRGGWGSASLSRGHPLDNCHRLSYIPIPSRSRKGRRPVTPAGGARAVPAGGGSSPSLSGGSGDTPGRHHDRSAALPLDWDRPSAGNTRVLPRPRKCVWN